MRSGEHEGWRRAPPLPAADSYLWRQFGLLICSRRPQAPGMGGGVRRGQWRHLGASPASTPAVFSLLVFLAASPNLGSAQARAPWMPSIGAQVRRRCSGNVVGLFVSACLVLPRRRAMKIPTSSSSSSDSERAKFPSLKRRRDDLQTWKDSPSPGRLFPERLYVPPSLMSVVKLNLHINRNTSAAAAVLAESMILLS